MKRKTSILAGVFAAISPLFIAAASAAPVSFQGGVFDLSAVAGGNGGHYTITYSADLTNFSPTSGQNYIGALAFRLPGNNDPSLTLPDVSGPGLGAGSAVVVSNNGIAANSGVCDAADPLKEWVCLTLGSRLVTTDPAPNSPTYTWVFDVTYAASPLDDLGNDFPSIKMSFFSTGSLTDVSKQGALLSCKTSGVANEACTGAPPPPPPPPPPPGQLPEPGSLALVGLGALGVGTFRRRKKLFDPNLGDK